MGSASVWPRGIRTVTLSWRNRSLPGWWFFPCWGRHDRRWTPVPMASRSACTVVSQSVFHRILTELLLPNVRASGAPARARQDGPLGTLLSSAGQKRRPFKGT